MEFKYSRTNYLGHDQWRALRRSAFGDYVFTITKTEDYYVLKVSTEGKRVLRPMIFHTWSGAVQYAEQMELL